MVNAAKLDGVGPAHKAAGDAMQTRVDMWPFVPHYPYPPPGKQGGPGLPLPSTSRGRVCH
jgi:hypothetical protein